jgi:hypothetical protein
MQGFAFGFDSFTAGALTGDEKSDQTEFSLEDKKGNVNKPHVRAVKTEISSFKLSKQRRRKHSPAVMIECLPSIARNLPQEFNETP